MVRLRAGALGASARPRCACALGELARHNFNQCVPLHIYRLLHCVVRYRVNDRVGCRPWRFAMFYYVTYMLGVCV
jgi:hypothetical protein